MVDNMNLRHLYNFSIFLFSSLLYIFIIDDYSLWVLNIPYFLGFIIVNLFFGFILFYLYKSEISFRFILMSSAPFFWFIYIGVEGGFDYDGYRGVVFFHALVHCSIIIMGGVLAFLLYKVLKRRNH